MSDDSFQSWGRYPRVEQRIVPLEWRREIRELPIERPLLAQGCARSYGDVCLNDGGTVLSTRRLNRFIAFDPHTGVLRAEAGVSLREILDLVVPHGWFLPVTPGTRYVSLGGAIANDIHGKDHHRAGTFGRHVRAFELLRSDGTRLVCTPSEHRALFEATIAGLGLTGLILWAEVQLTKIPSPFIDMESIQFGSLDEFLEISRSSEEEFVYTVAWIDCVSRGRQFGRGIFMRGNFCEAPSSKAAPARFRPRAAVPINLPGWVLNRLSIRAFNELYYRKQRRKVQRSVVPYGPFFYPLDAVGEWNRIYGRRGFLQFQCVVPEFSALRQVFDVVVQSGKASFLAVLKEFGTLTSPGLLSFPRPGSTLALDFPFEGSSTLAMMERLNSMVVDAGGALYPAKDACMRGAHFRRCYPRLEEFLRHRDPAFSSSFWRRVMEE